VGFELILGYVVGEVTGIAFKMESVVGIKAERGETN
jgi:hypothetical protein